MKQLIRGRSIRWFGFDLLKIKLDIEICSDSRQLARLPDHLGVFIQGHAIRLVLYFFPMCERIFD